MQTEREYLRAKEIPSLRCESVGEYSLPDYNGDVKRVLAVKSKVHPSGKFVGEDSVEISGTVAYEVVYLDSENNITHADFTTDYDAAVKINSETYVDSDVTTSVAGCNLRLVGPRKLSVKCSLDSEVCIAERRSYSIEGDAFMEYEPEILTAGAKVQTPAFAKAESREINEELFTVEGAIVDEVEVLLCDAVFGADEVSVSGEGATVKGSITLSALIKNANGAPQLIRKEVALSEELSLEDAQSLETLRASVEFASLKCAVTPTEDGVTVSASVLYTPKLSGRKNTSVELVGDAYLKERGSENEYSDFSYTEHLLSESLDRTLEFKKPLSELGLECVGEVVYAEVQPKVERCELSDGVVTVEGEMRFSGIVSCTSEDGAMNYVPLKFSAHFAENVNVNCQMHDNMRANCAINASEPKMYFDENNLYASADATFFLTLNAERRQRCLGASYLTDEEYNRDDSVVTVYYPEAGESLFSIAKRFHTSVLAIAESNRLSESVFASVSAPLGEHSVKKLIIK